MSALNGHPSPAAESAAARTSSVDTPFVDIHCHVLPGVDDGPSDMEGSLSMARALVQDGIGVVIATPHQLGRYEGTNGAPAIRAAVAEFQAVLNREQIPLQVYPGADVRIHERLIDLIDHDQVMTIADKKKHILLELPHETLIDLTFLCKALIARGIQPIMTHPERHHGLRRKPEMLRRWIDQGMAVQITAGSLIGLFGPNSQENAWNLISMGMVHVVATDAHDHEERPPVLSDALELLFEHVGRPIGRTLCIDNPAKILDGEMIYVANDGWRGGVGRGGVQPGAGR